MENSNPEKSKSQSSKLKVCEMSRKYLAIVGITPNLAHQSYPLNGTTLFGFLMHGATTYCISMFIVSDAETFIDYTQAIYSCSIVTLIELALLTLILKVEKLFELITGCDDLVNTSEYTPPSMGEN